MLEGFATLSANPPPHPWLCFPTCKQTRSRLRVALGIISSFHMRRSTSFLRYSNLPFILFFVSSLSITHQKALVQAAPPGPPTTPFDVGVILDRSSWIGNISWACMAMAIEDFYAAHPDYTTRLSLHLKDTDQDALSAASAAIDLLKNVQVQAIIGPQTSTQAKFMVELGTKIQIPIISFSAKSPSLSSVKSPYFIRTAWNDSSQAKVIASIVQCFNWKEVVPVFENSEYGNGIIPYLVDAFQDIGARVPYRSVIPTSATKDQILKELYKLKKERTRIFVVHMSYDLGFQLFSNAKVAGMMEKGYVWITTYGLTDLVDLRGSSASNVMQGVLGVKPFVKGSKKLHDFKRKWSKKQQQEDPNGEVTEPTVFGLWAYDTVWSLAGAAQHVKAMNFTILEHVVTTSSTDLATLGSSPTGRKLRDLIVNTIFNGISGKFHLIDGQLESNDFEIVNVLQHGRTRVGFWNSSHGLITNCSKCKNILWPGHSKNAPKGWEWPTGGKLRIGVPLKPGFEEFVRLKKDSQTNRKGFCIEVFEAVMRRLPYNVSYEYKSFNGTYDDLVYQVYLQNFDAVVGDVTIIANRSLYVDFTLPFTQSGVSMLVPVEDKHHRNAWTFLEPLTKDLWLASGAFFIFTGFTVWFLEHRINNDFRGTLSHQLGTFFYFSFSALVFAHREKVLGSLTRIVVIVWLFVVFVLQSSYTASLSSMLTVQQLQPTVNDLDELIKNKKDVGYLKDSFTPELLKRLNFNVSRLKAFESPGEYHDALSDGRVAAIVDEIPYIKVFLSKYCGMYTMVGRTYKTDGFGFVFPIGSPLVPGVSRAILNFTESDEMIYLEKKLYGNESCADPGETAVTSNSLTFNSFWGLFLITGIASSSALVLYVVFFLYEHREILRAPDTGSSVHQRLAMLAKLYDQLDPSHASKKAETAEPVMGHIVASPYADTRPQSPNSISSDANGNFGPEDDAGTPIEEEEPPGREIDSEIPDPPSFAEMPNQGGDSVSF